MASAGARAYNGGLGACPQRGPGAEPLVGGSGGRNAEHILFPCIKPRVTILNSSKKYWGPNTLSPQPNWRGHAPLAPLSRPPCQWPQKRIPLNRAIAVSGRTLNNLRYVDDIVLIANTPTEGKAAYT